MAYSPSLADLPEQKGYTPSLADVPHETVGSHLRDMGKGILNEVKAFAAHPGQSFLQAGNRIADAINPAVENTLQTGGAAYGNALSNMANIVPGVNIPMVQAGNPDSASGAVGNALGTALAFLTPGGIAKGAIGTARGAKALSTAAPYLSKAENALSKVPGGQKVANALKSATGKAVVGGAAFGATQNPEDRGAGAVEGGLAAGIPTGIFQTLGRYGGMASDAIPGIVKDIFKSKATPAEAKVASEMLGDLPVGVGHVLDSPALKQIEKGVNSIPLSGGVQRAEKVQQAAESQSDKLLRLMRGDQEEEAMARNLQEGIAKNAQGHKAEATRLYDDFLNTAKEQGVKITDTPETQAVAKKYLQEHQQNATPLDAKMVKKLEELSTPEMKPDMVKGAVPKTQEIDEIHNQIKALKKNARQIESKDPYLANTYNDLAGAMRKDLHETTMNAGNPDITAKLSAADKHYRENVVPYKQRDVQNIVGGKANLENIQNTLTQSKDHIEKVVSDLPDNLKKSTAYLKFKTAIKEQSTGEYGSEPQKLFAAYNRLSPVQKDKLFTQAEQKEFHKLGVLASASKESGRSSSYLKNAEILAPMYELLIHGNPLMAAKMLGGSAALGLGARGLGHYLSSPGLRNALINTPQANTVPVNKLNAMLPYLQAGMLSQTGGQ